MLDGLIMAFSMYTTIPMPQNKWNEKNFPFIIVNLCFVGVAIGFIWFFLTRLILKLDIPFSIKVALTCLIPLLLSGFIHIDGYMDTCDAIFSRASLEKKFEILKDSRVGAFAVIGLMVAGVFYYSSIYEILSQNKNLVALVFIPIFSRLFISLYIMKTKPSLETGFIASFKKELKGYHFFLTLIFLAFFISLAYFFNILPYIIWTFFASAFCYVYCIKSFKGISGDLCGFIITLSSLGGLLSLAII